MHQIPVIDLSATESNAEIATALVDAATTYGFVFIKNEGKDIPVKDIEQTFDLSRGFFASSVEEKETCKISDDNRGWGGMHTETLGGDENKHGDFKEVFNLGEFVSGKAQQPLPPSLQPHEADLSRFQSLCHSLCIKILDLFALGLDIDPPTWFSSRHRNGPSGTILRLLYYPSINRSASSAPLNPEACYRTGAHSDYGSITLLFQRPNQPGLEILPPSNPAASPSQSSSTWIPVPVYPPGTSDDPCPPILVNIGDLLSHWTNGLFKSTVHRVMFASSSSPGTQGDRYSIAYFCHPVGSTVLEAVPSEKVKTMGQGPDAVVKGERGRSMTADEHLIARLRATYLDLYKDDGGKG